MPQTTLNLPDFSHINIEAAGKELQQLIEKAKATITELEQLAEPSWESFALPMQQADSCIEDFFAPISHLNGVQNNDLLRDVYQKCIAELTAFSSECGQNAVLYQQYKKLAASDEAKAFTAAQKAWLNHAIRGFELSGVALSDDKKQRFSEIKSRLAELTQLFSNNVLDATDHYQLHLQDANALAGLPESLLTMFAEKAKAKSLEGFVVGLDMPSYQAVMTYCDNQALRKKLYFAYLCKASDTSEHSMDEAHQFDNSNVMVEILQLRQELAGLLGFANYAEVSLEKKMADSVEQVTEFLLGLADNSHSFAEEDIADLEVFAKKQLQMNALNPWDVGYVSEKFRQQNYALNEEEIREYFPLQQVLKGLFSITSELFAIDFEAVDDSTLYHPDAQLFHIKRGGEVIAAFYMDLFAREKKRGGAWMADCRSRWLNSKGVLQLPVAFLSCNFRPAGSGKPALLSHDEVTTLFHEFGHGLHHMLTKQDVLGVSGIAGVEWDAVELPSQFLENWCWQKESLARITKHFETGDALPEDLLNNMLAAKNFNAGLMMMRQLEFSLFDMLLHCLAAINNADQIQDMLDQVREKTAVIEPPLEARFQHSFGHIFAGGYAAGYYSYKWAEVLSADCFSAFEENGLFDKATGTKFLTEVLQAGSSNPASELFKSFRGREPNSDALLRHSGLTKQGAQV